jgi:hypothetical protein
MQSSLYWSSKTKPEAYTSLRIVLANGTPNILLVINGTTPTITWFVLKINILEAHPHDSENLKNNFTNSLRKKGFVL